MSTFDEGYEEAYYKKVGKLMRNHARKFVMGAKLHQTGRRDMIKVQYDYARDRIRGLAQSKSDDIVRSTNKIFERDERHKALRLYAAKVLDSVMLGQADPIRVIDEFTAKEF